MKKCRYHDTTCCCNSIECKWFIREKYTAGGNPVMELSQLPVFEIEGDEWELRKSFLELVTSKLAQLNLLCIVVEPDDLHPGKLRKLLQIL